MAKAEEAVAPGVKSTVPYPLSGKSGKVIVWGLPATVNVCLTGTATSQLVAPAWLAVITTVPFPTRWTFPATMDATAGLALA